MRLLRHPVFAFSLASTPFVVYSIRRTGYEFAHLTDIRLLGSVYVWPVILLTGLLLTASALYLRGKSHCVPTLISLAATAVFIGYQFFSDASLDYKLWIYIVAPSLVWCWVFSFPLAILMALLSARQVGRIKWTSTHVCFTFEFPETPRLD